MNSKEKFREVVDAFLSEMYVTEITNQCTRINIEEKIELIDDLLQVMSTEEKPVPEWLFDTKINLQNELKQLEK